MSLSPRVLQDAAGLSSFDAITSALDDPRPHPGEAALEQLGQALMTELLDTLLSTALEDFAPVICETFIGGLHAGVRRLERDADRARDRLARGLRDFDGSEVADHDLQDAKAHTDAADAAVRALELVRDAAALAYGVATGETWSPWRGGTSVSGLTAGQVDARAALRLAERRRSEAADPGGPVVAFRAAPTADTPLDAGRIFDALNWARSQWPDMAVALTGAAGGERLAQRWAQQKGVRLILARPAFDRHGRAAPFRANDVLLALEPICVLTLAASLERDRAAGARGFGPVLDLASRAAAQGLRCVRIRS